MATRLRSLAAQLATSSTQQPAAAVAAAAAAGGGGGQRYDLQCRASEIDPATRPHPEIGYVFEDDKGVPQDVQHAAVDTRVASTGNLVIWLMSYELGQGLFDRLTKLGQHCIQVHYANKWFGSVPQAVRDNGEACGQIRLEAATGEDHSGPRIPEWMGVPPADSIAGRAVKMVQWLAASNPEAAWADFLTADGMDLQWATKVTLAGISHGSTTAARFAKHQEVSRVVLFSGPRDQFDSWHAFPSATPTERYFAFTHVLDEGWPDHYHRSWKMLGLQAHGGLEDVDTATPPYHNSRTLISNADVGGSTQVAHTTVVPGSSAVRDGAGQFQFEPVWEYLFTHPTSP
eukprot:COSAG01_NODE_11076_length_2012_cov_12.241505_1_plen_344_part_00